MSGLEPLIRTGERWLIFISPRNFRPNMPLETSYFNFDASNCNASHVVVITMIASQLSFSFALSFFILVLTSPIYYFHYFFHYSLFYQGLVVEPTSHFHLKQAFFSILNQFAQIPYLSSLATSPGQTPLCHAVAITLFLGCLCVLFS